MSTGYEAILDSYLTESLKIQKPGLLILPEEEACVCILVRQLANQIVSAHWRMLPDMNIDDYLKFFSSQVAQRDTMLSLEVAES
jgi:hypothetical protein